MPLDGSIVIVGSSVNPFPLFVSWIFLISPKSTVASSRTIWSAPVVYVSATGFGKNSLMILWPKSVAVAVPVSSLKIPDGSTNLRGVLSASVSKVLIVTLFWDVTVVTVIPSPRPEP